MSDASASVPSSQLAPVSAAFRFVLEVAALVCWGVVGWRFGGSGLGVVSAVLLPLIGAVAWATFRVPGDASASGAAPVAVRGLVRLALELVLLLVGAVSVAVSGSPVVGSLVVAGVVVHYATTVSRVRWLIAR